MSQMPPITWPDACRHAPEILPAHGYDNPGVRSFFFENEPFRGKPTRVFGFMGLPYLEPGDQCPGIVLIHGGGGTAFDEWVRIWNRRGYAAIAIDLCGNRPQRPKPVDGGTYECDEYSGLSGWCSSFLQMSDSTSDHWQYHAVAALRRAFSLLAAQPGVDATRVGATGISWGGYLTCLMMGVETRLAAAVPVYGCGFITHNSCWRDTGYLGASASSVERWHQLWDPCHYIPHATMPTHWVSGTNDFAYPLDSLKKSYSLPRGPVSRSVTIELPHSHVAGWAPGEIHTFMDSVVRRSAPLPSVRDDRCDGKVIEARFHSDRPVEQAQLCYTRATGTWQDRKFNAMPATIDGDWIHAVLPVNTTVAFLTIRDDRGCTVSTPHWEASSER